jgi:hypothetical protein
MAEYISQRIATIANKKDADELRVLLEAMVDGIRAVCTLLDNDATLTATTCKATFDAAILKS